MRHLYDNRTDCTTNDSMYGIIFDKGLFHDKGKTHVRKISLQVKAENSLQHIKKQYLRSMLSCSAMLWSSFLLWDVWL